MLTMPRSRALPGGSDRCRQPTASRPPGTSFRQISRVERNRLNFGVVARTHQRHGGRRNADGQLEVHDQDAGGDRRRDLGGDRLGPHPGGDRPPARRPCWLSPRTSTRSLLAGAGVDAAAVEAATKAQVSRLPAASGSTVSGPSYARAVLQVLTTAQTVAAEMKDEYAAAEHLLIALATVESPARTRPVRGRRDRRRRCAARSRRSAPAGSPAPTRRSPTRRSRSTPSTSPRGPTTGSSTPSSAATRRSAGSCRCCRDAPRTTRC